MSSLAFDPVTSLWKLIWVLGVACLIAGFSFNLYMLKHNRMLEFQRKQKMEEFQRVQQRSQQLEAGLTSLFRDVAGFSVQYPEVRGILAKYGITVKQVPPKS